MASREVQSSATVNGDATPALEKAVAYGLPNPDTESEVSRLDVQHNIWALTLRGLSTTPGPQPDQPFSVIDIGCGTGAWSLSYANANPSAKVLGVDLNPPVPKEKPANCGFLKANVEEQPWEEAFLNEHGPFDIIHARMLVLGVRDWELFYQRCFKALKPGGWVELPDCRLGIWAADGKGDPPSAVETWGLTLEAATEADGRDWCANEKTTARLKALGFEHVEEEWFEWPAGYVDEGNVGKLDKGEQERQRMIAQLTLTNAQGFTMPVSKGLFTRSGVLGMQEAEALGEKAYSGLTEEGAEKRRYYLSMSYHKGQKPRI
ncbi:MAG: hypothetical protein M1828_003132 [Chrysothrix sp. TS-e1954]|nr:MAG: hypothetical protein M1828_003132 [Chrysothrix sp. TS-e1954]